MLLLLSGNSFWNSDFFKIHSKTIFFSSRILVILRNYQIMCIVDFLQCLHNPNWTFHIYFWVFVKMPIRSRDGKALNALFMCHQQTIKHQIPIQIIIRMKVKLSPNNIQYPNSNHWPNLSSKLSQLTWIVSIIQTHIIQARQEPITNYQSSTNIFPNIINQPKSTCHTTTKYLPNTQISAMKNYNNNNKKLHYNKRFWSI